MSLDFAAVLNGTGARAIDQLGRPVRLSAADVRRAVRRATVDSRRVEPGDLFVTVRGEHADGSCFAADAVARGAVAVLADRLPSPAPPAPTFVVPDTLDALQNLARYWRRCRPVPFVGITGSIGKTTTKEIVASVLGAGRNVLRTHSNYNTEIGVPLTILELDESHEVAVIEMGMYVPGDIALLAGIAQPDVGIVTNVAPIHLSRSGSIERIAAGKSELIQALPAHGLAILNADDVWTRTMAVSSGVAPAVLVGMAVDADYRLVDMEADGLDGTRFTVAAEGRTMAFRTRVPGAHNLHAFLIAIAVARHFGLEWGEIGDAIAAARLDVRQRIIRRGGSLIIDDSYNAAPMSMSAALDLLRAAPGRKIAVLGDMLELGPEEEAGHRQVGVKAAAVADWLIVRGPRSRWIADEAVRAGLPEERVLLADSNDGVVDNVRRIAGDSPGWAVLVKASNGMALGEIVRHLEALF